MDDRFFELFHIFNPILMKVLVKGRLVMSFLFLHFLQFFMQVQILIQILELKKSEVKIFQHLNLYLSTK